MMPVAAHDRPAAWSTGSQTTRLCEVVRRFVTGVAVLTCGDEREVYGVTVGTVALASMRPPMISVALRRNSRGLVELLRAASFVVNGLSAGQAELARYFAQRERRPGRDGQSEDMWGGCTADGVPLLADAVGWLDCRIERTVPIGDHELVLARVANAVRGHGTPLLSFAGGLHPGGLPHSPTPTDARS